MTRRQRMKTFARVLVVACLATSALGAAPKGSGSLATAEFPDVVEFNFEKVHAGYEKAGENVGKVTPVLDSALEKGQAALTAGQTARENPTDDNKKRFVEAVLGFVRCAAQGRTDIASLAEDVRGIQSQTAVLYRQADTQAQARVAELRKLFEREELKFKDIAARNKERRREPGLSDWELRKLFEEERRQAQTLNRLADQIAFQEDFLKALDRAGDQSTADFTLYEQFFAETGEVLADIGDLASNLPIVVERLQIAAAMGKTIPSRKAAVAGFAKVEKTRELTREIARQLMDVCAGDLGPAATDEERKVILRHTEVYKQWVDGKTVQYRRPGRSLN